MNEIIPFQYQKKEVRTLSINGEPWFVAGDVCAVLGLARVAVALSRIPDTQKDVCLADTPGGTQRVSIISEAGLYRLIMRSDKAEAEPFIAWVTEEVLPTLRKTGSYSVQPKVQLPDFNNPVIAARAWADEVEQKQIALQKIALDAPKVEYAETVMESEGSMSLRETAKTFGVGPNKFVEFLRRIGLLYERGSVNLPIQYYVEKGVFEVRAIASQYGHLGTQTLVTGKGQDYLQKKLQLNRNLGLHRDLIGKEIPYC